MVIVTRNVDLSVGSVLGLSAYLVGDLFVHHPHMPIVLAYALGIGVGVVCGAINGVITTVLRVPSLVVTLAVLYVIRGVDALIVNGKQIDPTSIPDSFQWIGSADVFNMPWLAIIVAVIVGGVGVRDAVLPQQPRPVRDRLQPAGGGARRRAQPASGCSPRSWSAAPSPASAACCSSSEFATVASTAGTGYELLVVAGGRGRRRRDLRRQRHGRRRRARRPAAQHDQPGARRVARSRRSGTRRSPAPCCSPRSPSTASSRSGSATHCVTRGGARGGA